MLKTSKEPLTNFKLMLLICLINNLKTRRQLNSDLTKEITVEYAKFFDDKILSKNLALAALYLATFELLKSTIIVNIRSFFFRGENIDPAKKQPKAYLEEMDKYFERYVNKSDREYLACCDWLVEMKSITEEDKELLIKIKKQRNDIAHELPYILIDPMREIDVKHLDIARQYIDKIDCWWILNVDLACNPDFDNNVDVNESQIVSSRTIMLNHIFSAFVKNFSSQNAVENSA